MGKYVPPHHKHAAQRRPYQVRARNEQQHEQALALNPPEPMLTWEDLPDMGTLRWCDLIEDEMEKEAPIQQESEWVTIKKKKKHRWKQ